MIEKTLIFTYCRIFKMNWTLNSVFSKSAFCHTLLHLTPQLLKEKAITGSSSIQPCVEVPTEIVAFNNNCSTVIELIKALKKNLADNRTIPELTEELTFMRSYPKRTPYRIFKQIR